MGSPQPIFLKPAAAPSAEEALRRFRLALDRSGELIGLIDLESMRYVDVNDPLCEALGYSREELLGMHPDELIPHSREELRQTYTRLTLGGEVPAIRSHYRRKDGTVLPYESRRHAVFSEGRWLIVSIARDIRAELAAEETLRRREQELRELVRNSPDIISRWSPDLRCLFVNDALRQASGKAPEEVIGRRLGDMGEAPEFVRMVTENCARVIASGEPHTAEFAYPTPEGEPKHYEMRLLAERGADGKVASVLMINRDLTSRVRAEAEVRRREEEFRTVAENAPDGIMRFDAQLRCVYANAAIVKTAGRALDAMLGRPLAQFDLPADVRDALVAAVRGALQTGETQTIEFRFMGPRGERYYQARLAPEKGPDGRPATVLGISRDITGRKQHEARIHHLANHDGLTGLPNRTLLRDRVEQAIAHARRTQTHVALMFVDLDQFKLVNDSWGHTAGDHLLLEVARRLQGAVRDGDTVARLGGDEFVVLLQDLSRPGDCALVARKIESALEAPVAVLERSVRVTASIGISMFPGDGDDLDGLLQCADAAMYKAKDAGRNGYQYYSAEMGAAARARVEIEGGLRQALERNEFLLHFQPQVRLADGAVSGCEALLRWQRPGLGLVSPLEFIPVAEETGMIVPIGDWVLRAACREAAAWSKAGLGRKKVAVNLSPRQFWRGSITESVRNALDESGLPADQLEVEITESVLARDLQQVMRTLEQLRRMGVCVTIDDFGTGYSSLSYLRSLPIQKLKIDKSFIRGIPGDRQATALVGEIIRLAHVLSLEVVAEGVESAAQAALLRDAGCEAMQGFYYSRPVGSADCAALLRSARALGLSGALDP